MSIDTTQLSKVLAVAGTTGEIFWIQHDARTIGEILRIQHGTRILTPKELLQCVLGKIASIDYYKAASLPMHD